MLTSIQRKKAGKGSFFRKGKEHHEKVRELTRLSGEIKTRNHISCPSSSLPLYNSFSLLCLLLGPLQTLWYLQFGVTSSQLLIILRWVTGLPMNQASSALLLALDLLLCFFLPPLGGKAGERKSKAYIHHSSIWLGLGSSDKNREGNRKSQLKGSFWVVCVWFSAVPHHHRYYRDSLASVALN